MSTLLSLVRDMGSYLPTFRKGVAEFNHGQFWQCHETLEEVWRAQQGPIRDFYKGIIQVAAGLHHLSRRNLPGTDLLLGRAIAYLEPFAPRCLGVEVASLIADACRCRQAALALGPERLDEFDRSLMPRLEFRPQEARLRPASGLVEANGLTLHFLDWGGHGPPLLFLHATGFLSRLWQPIAAALSLGRVASGDSPRYRILAIDHRGHGDSDAPADDYHWRHFVDDLRALIAALGLQPPAAVGHSLGGAVAAYCEATAPGTFSRLLLVDPIIFPQRRLLRPEDSSLARRTRHRRLQWASRQQVLESYRSRPPFNTWRQDVLELYVQWGLRAHRQGGVVLKCRGDIEAQVYESSTSLDTFERLPHVRCPTLVLRGDRSDAISPALAQRIATRLPYGRLATIPGAGHLAPMEQPDAVAQAIAEFLANGG
ncbi:MAG: alpha/beta fold hydrolase [Dehalococcoidia bacterium]